MRSTRVHLHIRAPRAAVYRLLLDAEAIVNWSAGLPPGVSLVDNETGWRMALAKLAALAEGR